MTNPITQFNPEYKITIFTSKNTYIIDSKESYLTCHVSVVRNVLSETNQATVQIYNLAPKTREGIFQDQFYDYRDEKNHKYIHIEAGYSGATPLIFSGRILQAYSYRTGGSTDVITDIQAIPFDIFNNQSSVTFKEGTTYKEAIKRLASDLPSVKVGDIGAIEGTFKTPTTFDGNTFECINTITQGHSFVDNGILRTLMDNEVCKVPVPLITNDTVLLDTPRRRDANLEITTIFLPDIIVGQLVEIKSNVASNFDGQFKLVGFTHDCLFSQTQAGQRTTKMTLWIGPMLPGANIALTQDKDKEAQKTEQESSTGGAAPVNNFNQVQGEDITPVANTKTNTNWIMPCKGTIRGTFGEKRPDHTHNGLDIAVVVGTPVKAIADGKVIRTGSATGYGKWVVLDHGKINGINVTSEYGHISKSTVYIGQKVKQGDTIALSGNAGRSDGPHLHLTVREGAFQGKGVNPFKYIKN